jgi:hypothetical protein
LSTFSTSIHAIGFQSAGASLNPMSFNVGGIASAACLEQEPGTPLRFVNPNFDQAASSNVLVFLAHTMG